MIELRTDASGAVKHTMFGADGTLIAGDVDYAKGYQATFRCAP
ncbi:MAG: hypothetical protein R3F59_21365 [Myxococcota bacterium]